MRLASILLASAALTGIIGHASAADAVLEVAEPQVSFSWTGSYVGVWGGGRIGDIDWATTEVFNPNGDPIPFESDPNASDSSTSGRVAVYAGYNWQFSPAWVAGIEADLGYGDNSIRIDRIPGLWEEASFAEMELGLDGSLRGRLGYLVSPTVLVYGTGGVAFQEAEASATCPADGEVCNPATGTITTSSSDTLLGWTIGGGVEAAVFGNWLVRADYRYSDFEDFNVTAMQVSEDSFGAEADISVDTHTFGVGIGYKF
jgi:outer membrane immunogenic protein